MQIVLRLILYLSASVCGRIIPHAFDRYGHSYEDFLKEFRQNFFIHKFLIKPPVYYLNPPEVISADKIFLRAFRNAVVCKWIHISFLLKDRY